MQIQTAGGLDTVGAVRKGSGPTTGLVVDADGFVISSAFNFANKPTEIFVTVPGHKDRYYAKVVATDQTRMLTLLKIEAKGLVVPAAADRKAFKVGQWSIALGRTLGGVDTPPSVSVGIISALDRIWGKAIQSDAKISPVNYGGPVVDIAGKVQGVLVPASPRGQDETAGVEWYDSGIGFAIPLEDINAVLPRLKKGENLTRGLLGITPQGQDIYSGSPTIGTVAPESAAAKAGIKPGDVILEIDGTKVERQAQVMHALGKKYEGDTVSIKVKRGAETKDFPNLKLTGVLTVFAPLVPGHPADAGRSGAGRRNPLRVPQEPRRRRRAEARRPASWRWASASKASSRSRAVKGSPRCSIPSRPARKSDSTSARRAKRTTRPCRSSSKR